MSVITTTAYASDSCVAATNLTLNAADFKLQLSVLEAKFDVRPTLSNLVILFQKPSALSIDYNFPNQDLRFQFINKGNLLDKEVNMTYTHWRKENRVALDGTLSIDSRNKVSANYEFGTKNCKLKYSYVQGEGARLFEPCYDLANNYWDFLFSQRFYEDNLFKASFQSSTNVFGLEWCRTSSCNGSLKVLASLNVTEKLKIPKVCLESTWNFSI
ncbi:outer envelope pore protein 24A, chloroplastic-like [Silene latifolia]|uniref:outer envelope pore protein 24A, chloroplastic-like n=1 Tax=Silene latifolia TaxID=37657 RepID=UPI003D772C9B